jgi:hypothetical protein
MSKDRETPKANGLSEDAEASPREKAELLEGQDYYVEHGLLVFTAAFLQRRGTCCESGCRHCPYRNPAATESQTEKGE